MKSLMQYFLCALLVFGSTIFQPATAQPYDPGIFYVRVFDGYMPIPSRYGVDNLPVESRNAVRFISPVSVAMSTEDAPAHSEIPKTIGYIETGKRARNAPEPFSLDDEVTVTDRSSERGLRIIKFEYNNVDGLAGVYFYTDTEFMLIVDDDADLWRSMLDSFVRPDSE